MVEISDPKIIERAVITWRRLDAHPNVSMVYRRVVANTLPTGTNGPFGSMIHRIETWYVFKTMLHPKRIIG